MPPHPKSEATGTPGNRLVRSIEQPIDLPWMRSLGIATSPPEEHDRCKTGDGRKNRLTAVYADTGTRSTPR